MLFRSGGSPVLEQVSATIAPGQTVAIVGHTGSGKSTLINLLTRLYDPPPGTVFVDGIDICALPLPVLRGAIGVVPQEPFLFSDTLANNVAFGADAGERRLGLAGAEEAPTGSAAEKGPKASGDQGPEQSATSDRRARIEAAAAVARLDKIGRAHV